MTGVQTCALPIYWEREQFRGRELFGKTVGIVGMGRLGRIVAGYFQAFGMKVIGYDTDLRDFPEDIDRTDDIHRLLSRSDVVSLHVPYSPATRHMLGDIELRHMRPDAILLNTSRGGVVDEAALAEAIAEKRISGAAVDVLDNRFRSPLIELSRSTDRVLITPHIGGNTQESCAKTDVFLAKKVVEVLRENSRAHSGPRG